MRKTLLISAVLLAHVGAVQARCLTNDPWTGPDKKKHLVAGLVMGSGATLAFKSPHKGFAAGLIGAALIETQGVCTLQDFVVTAAGAAAGAYGTAWLILPRKDGVQVAFVGRF